MRTYPTEERDWIGICIIATRWMNQRFALIPKSNSLLLFFWRQIVPVVIVCGLANICFATELGQWQLNAWGSISPSVVFERSDMSCLWQGTPSSSFRITSRGNGDAEVTLPSVLEPDKPYRFNVWIRSSSPALVDVFFRRDGFPYETTAIRSLRVSGWTQVDLLGIHASTGRGSVRIAVQEDNVTVCIASASLSPLEFSSVGVQPNSSLIDPHFFGVHLNRLGVHNGWPTFDPGTLRLWDSGTTWAQLQPDNSPIDWMRNPYAQRLDYYARHGQSKHNDLQFIYTLGMTPTWAGRRHPKNCNNSSYGPSVCTKPFDIESWRKYVRALGLRFKGVIRIWEIWNEADVWVHWDESPEDMVLLVKIAAQELKAIDPNNQIIGPNITSGGLRFLSRFLTAGGDAYIDGISIHAYLGRVPEKSLAQIKNVRQMLKDLGLNNLSIWNTESAVSCNTLLEDCKAFNAKSQSGLSGEDALAQGVIGNAALGVKSFVYYTWEGASVEYGNLPLVEANYKTPTKAGRILSTIKMWLTGSRIKLETSTRNGLNVVELNKGGATSFILWSSGSPLKIDRMRFPSVDSYMLAGDGKAQPLTSAIISLGAEPMLVFSSSYPVTN